MLSFNLNLDQTKLKLRDSSLSTHLLRNFIWDKPLRSASLFHLPNHLHGSTLKSINRLQVGRFFSVGRQTDCHHFDLVLSLLPHLGFQLIWESREDCIMALGSKRSSASSNSTATLRGTGAVPNVTAAPTSAPQIDASTPLSASSPSTNMSVVGAPSTSQRHTRVRGRTLGKGVRREIASRNGERLSVYVLTSMRTFCGKNATKLSNEIGSQIRRMCPIQGFAHTWKRVDSMRKEAIMQLVRDKFKVTEKESVLGEDIEEGNEHTDLIEEAFNVKANLRYKEWKHNMGSHYWKMKDADEVDPFQHPYRGINMDGWKWLIDNIFTDKDWMGRKAAGKQNRSFLSPGHTLGSKSLAAAMTISAENHKGVLPDFCDTYKASHTLKETEDWIDDKCKEQHEKMVAIRDEARTLNMEVTGEYLSRTVLGERKNYLRGFGVGPMPSSYTSISSSNSTRQDQLQKMVDAQMELFRAEREKEREEEQTRHEAEEQKRREEREEEERRREEEEQRWREEREEAEQRWREEREEQQRRHEEAARRQDENAARLQREIDVLKSLMRQQMKGQGNLGSG